MRFIVVYLLFVSVTVVAQEKRVQADSLLNFAKKFIGTKYCYAQCTPQKGFDCSGFVYHVFDHFGIKVPRASMDYENAGKIVSIDSCLTGDVIVFTGTNARNRVPGHVGIIASHDENGVVFIHSSSGHNQIGVIMTDFTHSPAYKKRFIKIVRLQAVH